MEKEDKVDVSCWPSDVENNIWNKTGTPLGMEPGVIEPSHHFAGDHSYGTRTPNRTTELKDKVDLPCVPSNLDSNTGNMTGAPLAIKPGVIEPSHHFAGDHSYGIRTPNRAVKEKDKVDVPCWASKSDCNTGKKTGAPLAIDRGRIEPGNHPGRDHSCGTRTQDRAVEQNNKVDDTCLPSKSDCNTGNLTEAPLAIDPGRIEPGNHTGRDHSCGTRTQNRTMEQKDKVDLPCLPSNSDSNTGNMTGAPLAIKPGVIEASHHFAGDHSYGTRTPNRAMKEKDKVDVPCWASKSDCNTGKKTGAPLAIDPGRIEPGNHPGRDHSCGTRTQKRTTEQKDKVDLPCLPFNWDSNTGNMTGAPLAIKPGVIEASHHFTGDHSYGTRTPNRAMEQKAKVDVARWSPTSDFNAGNKSGALLGIEPGLIELASHPARVYRTQNRATEQTDKVVVPSWPSNLECHTWNKTGALQGTKPRLRVIANNPGRGHSCGTRTQAKAMEQKYKVDVSWWPSNLGCNMGNKTGAPLRIEPGLVEPSNQPGRDHSCGTRTQAGAVEPKDKVDVTCWPSKSDCITGNKTGAPLGIKPGLIEPENHPGRGHLCGSRTQARAVEQKHKVDVSWRPSNSDCNTRNMTGAPLGIESGLGESSNHPGGDHSCGTRTPNKATEQANKVGVPCWPSNSECHTWNKTGALLGTEPRLRVIANNPGRGHSCDTRTQARAMEQKYKVDVSWWPSNLGCNTGNKTGGPLRIEPGLREPANHPARGHSCGTRTQARAMEQKDKVDVSWWPSSLECNAGNKTGALLGIEPGLRVLANHPGRGHSCGTRTQARDMEQKYKVDISRWPSNLECNTGTKTGAPLAIKPGLVEPTNHPDRGHSCAIRTQARAVEPKVKVDVSCWPSNLESNMGNETGAPLGIQPGLRELASHPDRGHSCGTRTQNRAVEQKVKVDVSCWPSNLESKMGNETGAPLGIQPGLREPANHHVRGHSHGTSTQAREHSEALPALGSEKRVHGVLLKRRQIRLPRTTKAVAHKPLRQGKKSSAKARAGKENSVCQPEVLTFTSPQEESSQGPPLFCWPPPLSPPPYMTMTLGQHLIVSPSLELHGAFALSNPCLDMIPLPCSSMEHHPPEPQGPIASDQASGSATLECQETLEAAEALMTLKNSSWTWRQTHH